MVGRIRLGEKQTRGVRRKKSRPFMHSFIVSGSARSRESTKVAQRHRVTSIEHYESPLVLHTLRP